MYVNVLTLREANKGHKVCRIAYEVWIQTFTYRSSRAQLWLADWFSFRFTYFFTWRPDRTLRTNETLEYRDERVCY